MLKELKEDMGKVQRTMWEHNGNIRKEGENLKKRNQKEILELKSMITEMKNSLKGFKGRFERQRKEEETVENFESEE
jgi:peptidoglycan hydrolase CwlO-like protein